MPLNRKGWDMDPRLIIHRSVELERACAYVGPDGRPPRQLVMQADGRGPSVALHMTCRAARWRGCTECGACQVEHGEEQAVGELGRAAGALGPTKRPRGGRTSSDRLRSQGLRERGAQPWSGVYKDGMWIHV